VRGPKEEAEMNRPSAIVPITIIVNACIWGFAMIMCSYTLKGTGAYQEIQNILAGCTFASIIVVGGGLAAVAKARK
jgi:hypothetical protein